MQIKLKVTLVNEEQEEFMGIGLVWLLRRIGETKSIRQAAAQMDLSYVKALRMLNRLEENLEQSVIERQRGGHERGGAELTDFGRHFLAEFDAMQLRIKSGAEKEFERFMRRKGGRRKCEKN